MMMLNNTMNITSTICFFDSNSETAFLISKVILYASGLLCVVFGLPGHLFQGLIMLNKSNRKEFTSFYLVAIAVCEFFYLAS
jgi:hypothetical protein